MGDRRRRLPVSELPSAMGKHLAEDAAHGEQAQDRMKGQMPRTNSHAPLAMLASGQASNSTIKLMHNSETKVDAAL